jgi:adenylate cyclase
VYEAHCPAHGRTVPFLPLLELLRSYFGIGEGDSDGEARHKIAGTVLLLDESFRELLPLLLEFLGVPDPERPAPRMDPEARQRQLYGLVRRLVQARSTRELTLLFVDDVHWIDPASDGFLAQLVEAVTGTRALLLVNFRPEYQADWFRKSHYQQLPLLPLGPEGIQALLRDLLGEDASVAELFEPIRERTGGNPFFVEEVVQSLAEAGTLEGSRGAYRLRGALDEVSVPASVQAVLAARIDRLAEREKRLLQTAAVIGKRFSEPVLAAVAELPEVDLAGALRTLEGAEFIHADELYPVAVYGFKHPLTQEVALYSQLGNRRSRTHALVARALTELRSDQLDEAAALIAYHWEEAGEALEASRWHRRAAEWAGVRDAVEADRHWRRLVDLLEPFSRSLETDALRLAAITERINLAWRVGMTEQDAEALFSKGEQLAQEIEDLRGLAILQTRYAFLLGIYNRFPEQLALSRSALELAESLGDVPLQVGCAYARARALIWFGRLEECQVLVDRGLALADDDPRLGWEVMRASPYLWLRLMEAVLRAWGGQPSEAVTIFERAMRIAYEIGEVDTLAFLHSNAMWAHFFLGDGRGAAGRGRQAVEIAARAGGSWQRLDAAILHSFGLAALGDWNAASAEAERVRAIAAESGMGLEWQPVALIVTSAARLGQGDPESARELGREAVRLVREHGIDLMEVLGLYYLVQALLRPEASAELDEAEASLAAGMERLRAIGAHSWEPLMREQAAELARLRGDLPRREHELREAHRLFVEMGATAHAERVARELGS